MPVPPPSQPSPATWHVVFWVLMALAISSMAQPAGKICGRPGRYRVYLASSPILCVADAVSMLAHLAAAMYYMGIGPKKASQLVVLARSDDAREGVGIESRPSAGFQSHTWPRIFFFIMSTLPAAIKLASLSGVPWTKTWGMMFVTSFIAIELVTLLSRTSDPADKTSISASPDLRSIEHEKGDQRGQVLRAKAARLSRTVEFLDLFFFRLGLLAHAGLIAWTMAMLRGVTANPYLHDLCLIVKVALGLLVTLFSVTVWWYLLRGCITGSLPKGDSMKRALIWLLKGYYVLLFLPEEKPPNRKTRLPLYFDSMNQYVVIWLHLFAFLFMCWWILHPICKRWPTIARALLLDPGGRDASQGEEARAWISFCFFMSNLGLCVLWYAFRYDSTGTVNPSWTDVFA
ncbi:hypothetical protein EPUS_07512 [Endocarpon pusillum Z07020]|uniref:Uncharacterized protein n=1 Tax=Endocarpon pusillum (strain Z07020 / HMAS-L-300199) TaxID=1263415 RepID=U1GMT5_ENDPU|nr:uncharacterized protein EPUS_07512 [Endocarpon pusillum Z07020]ERF73578.1 hypothetical protein EPUS_07512 [Endocarpon pusillum Z07020]